jgi:hypothetical protein
LFCCICERNFRRNVSTDESSGSTPTSVLDEIDNRSE